MKYLFSLCLLASFLFFENQAFAQDEAPVVSTKKHKVLFHLTSSDTLVQKAMVKQIHNFLAGAPNSKIEVVCHNNGISFLQKAQSKQADKIHELAGRGVVFVACENTMRERKIKKEEIVADAGYVPAGVIEVVLKQEKGWSYIRAGQ